MTTQTTTETTTDRCLDCGKRAEWRRCAHCGAEAVVIDCGHRAQPAPISASAYLRHEATCEECEEALAEIETCANPYRADSTIPGERQLAAAWDSGYTDGLAWDLSGYDSIEEAASDTGWSDATINAVGRSACAVEWGCGPGLAWWDEAVAAYEAGCRRAIARRALDA